jgi:streptomycin 6-kinase
MTYFRYFSGDYVMVEQIKDNKTKVAGEIIHVLYTPQKQYLKTLQLWPTEFNTPIPATVTIAAEEQPLFVNTNRCPFLSSDEDLLASPD